MLDRIGLYIALVVGVYWGSRGDRGVLQLQRRLVSDEVQKDDFDPYFDVVEWGYEQLGSEEVSRAR
jgi:hypothetical protein